MPVVDGGAADTGRTIYPMTRDNVPEGDAAVSGIARRSGWTRHLPPPLRIEVPAHVGAHFERVVSRVADADAAGGSGHLWKLVRSFDDPDTWTDPGVRHLASDGLVGETFRTEPLPDDWELYDLDVDPREARNRWDDPAAAAVFERLRDGSSPSAPAPLPNAAAGGRTPTAQALEDQR